MVSVMVERAGLRLDDGSTVVAAVGESVACPAVVTELIDGELEATARAAFRDVHSHPNFREQPGHARQPEVAKTRSATMICCSRVAW